MGPREVEDVRWTPVAEWEVEVPGIGEMGIGAEGVCDMITMPGGMV